MNLTGEIKALERGKIIEWAPALGSISLLGATVMLVVVYPDRRTRKVLGPFQVAADGLSAVYFTNASDFLIGGSFLFQFTADYPGVHLETDIIPQTVGDSL